MFKITFLGAGSTVFAKNVLGDIILTPEFEGYEIALFDIDPIRLEDSYLMLCNINKKYNGKATILKYTNRIEALRGANYIVNAINVGGYKPCTVTDFEVTKRHGLYQTIGDTLGVAGVFRAMRTIPVLESISEDIHKVCPNALFINYTNPMCMITGYLIRKLDINAVGLCHSVQYCVEGLFKSLGMEDYIGNVKSVIYGINHQAWLLEIRDLKGNDLYPEIKARSLSGKYEKEMAWDLVRHDIMNKFGYYNTESSEHTSEYLPYYIKSKYPELIEKYKIEIDKYPGICEKQIAEWAELRKKVTSESVEHVKSREFAAPIIKAMQFDIPYRVHGNVINWNNSLIKNLPDKACVEVPCLVDRNGISPCAQKELPEHLAAINRTNINVQMTAIDAAATRSKEMLYRACFLDPHTAAELSLDDIKSLVDDMIVAHKGWIPEFR